MPAKYRQGVDPYDLLRMLARAYKSNLCTGQWGILRDNIQLPEHAIVCQFEEYCFSLKEIKLQTGRKRQIFRVSKTNLEGVPNDPIIWGEKDKNFIFSTFCKLEINTYLLFIID